MVTNIRTADRKLCLGTNGGKATANKKADLKGYGKVWFNDKSITNIISLARMAKKYCVRYDSWQEDAFIVDTDKGVRKFVHGHDNIYKYLPPIKNVPLQLLETIEENKKYYTNHQFQQAKAAQKFLQAVGYPHIKDLKNIISINGVRNCPITIEDINIAEKIYGKDIASLKGKLKQQKSIPVISEIIEIPKELMI